MAYINAEGRTLYAESFGDDQDPPLLLICGLASQLISYPEEFFQAFVDRGFFVIGMDNRDVGLSTSFANGPDYSLVDMADDCVEVLNHFGAAPAHIFGFSMGAMIGQTLAIERPEVVSSLTCVASRTGNSAFGRSTEQAKNALARPEAQNREDFIAGRIAGKQAWGTPDTWHEDELRVRYGRAWDRGQSPGAGRRHMAAIAASGNREADLATLNTPTLVIHGAIDPLIQPSGGQRTAEIIPGATYVEIEQMAHDLPRTEVPHIVALVTAHVADAEAHA